MEEPRTVLVLYGGVQTHIVPFGLGRLQNHIQLLVLLITARQEELYRVYLVMLPLMDILIPQFPIILARPAILNLVVTVIKQPRKLALQARQLGQTAVHLLAMIHRQAYGK
jgi:hypothetical protein